MLAVFALVRSRAVRSTDQYGVLRSARPCSFAVMVVRPVSVSTAASQMCTPKLGAALAEFNELVRRRECERERMGKRGRSLKRKRQHIMRVK